MFFVLSSAIRRAVPYNICNSKMVIIFTHSFSAARLSSSTWYKPTLAMGIRSSGTLAPGVGRAGAMRWLQFKKGYFLAANILYDTFSSKFTMTELCRYISKGIWIAMNVSLETSFRMSVRPVEKVFCFCLYSLSCFMLFMLLFFLTKKHTRLVQSHKLHTSCGEQGMQGVFSILSFLSHLWFQSCPICRTFDFNHSYLSLIWLSLFQLSLISGVFNPIFLSLFCFDRP